MLAPRWRKIWRDLASNRVRTALVVLSIAAGVFAVGLISGGLAGLLRDLDTDYQAVTPHSAVILSETFDDDSVKSAEHVPGVASAEGRRQLTGRVRLPGGEWRSARIVALKDPQDTRVDRLRPSTPGGSLALANKQVLLERSATAVLPVGPGGRLELELPLRSSPDLPSVRVLQVAGIAHDVTIQPTAMSGDVNLYINLDTLEWLTGSRLFDRLLVRVAERPSDEAHVRDIARLVTDKLERGDRHILATVVSRPGEHPNTFIIRGLLVLLIGLGGLAVALSGFLVATTTNGLLGQQVRQIGVMKAIGGTTPQLLGMFIGLVLGFGILALALAALPSALAAYWAVGMVATFLNFNAGPFHLPLEAFALQTAVALGVPLLAGLPAVLGATRISVRAALDYHGLTGQLRPGHNAGPDKHAAARPRSRPRFSRPLLLSIRNMLRRRGRLVLTLVTLTLAGAIFVAVFNVKASFSGTIEEALGYFLANVNVSLGHPYRTEQIEQIVNSVPGVSHVEAWGIASGQVLAPDQKTSVDVTILAPPARSALVRPVLTAGRWLAPGDDGAIVIGNQMRSRRPDIQVGDSITIRILGKKYTWHVVGVFKMAGAGTRPMLYAGYDDLARTLNEMGRAGSYHLVTQAQDGAAEAHVARAVETELKSAGIQVADVTTGSSQRAEEHAGIDILVYFLIGMATLIAIVGGLGLMGTMSMNVMERSHEIGVLRAIGASDGHIVRLVILEGLAIGAVSWLLGAALSLPVSKLLSDLLGVAILSTPLRLVMPPEGFALWLGVVLALAALASILPAYRATRLTVREVLAYE